MLSPQSIGAATLDGLAYVGSLARLGAYATVAALKDMFSPRRLAYGRAVHQATAVGIGALPILSLISFFIGTILALQAAYELRKFGALQFVASAVAISVSRELGPLMTAILVIGRSGSSFAAELGTMKVNEEIDAMETMALNPIRFLVAPKLFAMLLMMPCLTIWADFMGVVGGSVFGMIAAGFTFKTYIIATMDALVLRDVMTGLVKSLMFAIVITTVGCQEGLRTGLGAEEVGRSTTAAVVKAIFLVIMVDLVFTAMFYLNAGPK
jgi:phospholipid/cholesterol/gamma-HCH transport system permease protein